VCSLWPERSLRYRRLVSHAPGAALPYATRSDLCGQHPMYSTNMSQYGKTSAVMHGLDDNREWRKGVSNVYTT